MTHNEALLQARVKGLEYENKMLLTFIRTLGLGSPEDEEPRRPIRKGKRKNGCLKEKGKGCSKKNEGKKECPNNEERGPDELMKALRTPGVLDSDIRIETIDLRNAPTEEEAAADEIEFVPKPKAERPRTAETINLVPAQQLTEMKELYGSRADQVMAKEMTMQLEFDQICDKEKPGLWPVLPINMVFD